MEEQILNLVKDYLKENMKVEVLTIPPECKKHIFTLYLGEEELCSTHFYT